MRAPSSGWRRISESSSSSSGPGLRRIRSGTASLPRSCSAAPRRSTSTSPSSQPSRAATTSAITPTRAACPDECGSLASIACDRASKVVIAGDVFSPAARAPSLAARPIPLHRVSRGMRIGVPKETAPGERRVALVPDVVSRLTGAGFDVLVEKGAGTEASFTDAAYSEAGASLVDGVFGQAEGIVKVQKPSADEAAQLRRGDVLGGFLEPLTDPEGVDR